MVVPVLCCLIAFDFLAQFSISVQPGFPQVGARARAPFP
jgi:hypothetical protein